MIFYNGLAGVVPVAKSQPKEPRFRREANTMRIGGMKLTVSLVALVVANLVPLINRSHRIAAKNEDGK
jgi:hypothetical protein